MRGTRRQPTSSRPTSATASRVRQRLSGSPRLAPRVATALASARRPWLLVPLGAATVVATVVGSFVLPQTPIRMSRTTAELIPSSGVWEPIASLPWPVPVDPTLIATVIVVSGALAFAAYAAAVAIVWGRPSTGRLLAGVLTPAAVALTISTVALPTQSSDIVDYLLSGRVVVVHDADPYVVPPDAFPDDPLLYYASGQYTADPEAKPPIWLGGAITAAAVTQDASPADAVLLTRVMFLGLTLLNAGLIAAILRRWRPQHLLAGLVLYTWSPIVLVHGQAKFDTLMATFALLAALALVHSRPLASVAALWASVMVKLLTAPLLAVSVLGDLVARRWRRVLVSVGLVGAMTMLLYLPFDGGISKAVSHLTDASGSGSSLPGPVMLVVGAVAGVLLVRAAVRSGGEIDATLQAWAVAALAVAPLSLTTSAWYLVMPIAIVSLSGERWRTAVLVAVSAVALLVDTWGRHSNREHPLPEPLGLTRSEGLLVAAALGAIGAVAVLGGRRGNSRRESAGADGRSSRDPEDLTATAESR